MYVDGYVAAVPADRKDDYIRDAKLAIEVFLDHGATRVVECWGDDVPEGEKTSLPMAVRAEPGEVVVFAWMEFPDKEARDRCIERSMADPRMAQHEGQTPAFDATRMIYGSFTAMLDARKEGRS